MRFFALLALAALLFSVQTLVSKLYQKKYGQGVKQTFVLLFGAGISGFVLFYLLFAVQNKVVFLPFTVFTFLMSFFFALCIFAFMLLMIRVLAIGNIAQFSMTAILGAILLPSLTGLLFFNEKATALKITAFVLMLAAIVLSSAQFFGKKNGSKKIFLYYGALFFINGIAATLGFVHQNLQHYAAGGETVYLAWGHLWMTVFGVIGLAILLISVKRKADSGAAGDTKSLLHEDRAQAVRFKIRPLVFLFPLLYGIFNGTGNGLTLSVMSSDNLGAFITAPFVNGLTIALSTLFGVIIFREKLNRISTASLILTLSAIILYFF